VIFIKYLILFSVMFSQCTLASEINKQKKSLQISEILLALNNSSFSGIVDKDVTISSLGSIKNKSSELNVYVYKREFSTHRLARRLIFISNDYQYHGMYSIDDDPISLSEDSILFNYDSNLGNVIRLEDSGLPKKIYLDGEVKFIYQ
jgi:hypothetical protein